MRKIVLFIVPLIVSFFVCLALPAREGFVPYGYLSPQCLLLVAILRHFSNSVHQSYNHTDVASNKQSAGGPLACSADCVG